MAAFREPSNFRLVQVAAFAFILSRCITVADVCVKQDSCSCKTKTRTVDLHSLDTAKTGQPRFKDVPFSPDTSYSYNPCTDFTESSCQGVAACQIQGSGYFSLGSQASVVMSGDPDAGTLMFQYSSSEVVKRTTNVKIICDYGTDGQLIAEGENPQLTYTFTLKTNLFCPPTSSLSVGSILVILFFVFLAVYWIGGILFLRFVRKAQGAEMIPNYEFWTDFPFLIRDGVLFVFRGCKAESTYEKI